MQKKSKNRRFYQKTGKNNIRGKQEGITLVALAITIIVYYDKMIKRCNIKSFLHFGYRLRWVKTHLFLKSW